MNNEKKISLCGNGQSYAETLVQTGTPHKITYTNNSVEVEVNETNYIFTDNNLSAAELGFIGRAKKCVIEMSEKLRLPDRNPVFAKIYPAKSGFYGNLTEIDISSAYWETARKVGLISDKIYLQGNSVEKKTRLIAFGAAAAVKRSCNFDGFMYSNYYEEYNEHGRRAYFYVASYVTKIMREICDEIPGAAMLYWVDAIVCKPEYAPFVCRRIFEHGFSMKQKTLTDCILSYENRVPVWTVTEADSQRKKQFRGHRKGTQAISRMINEHLEKK